MHTAQGLRPHHWQGPDRHTLRSQRLLSFHHTHPPRSAPVLSSSCVLGTLMHIEDTTVVNGAEAIRSRSSHTVEEDNDKQEDTEKEKIRSHQGGGI